MISELSSIREEEEGARKNKKGKSKKNAEKTQNVESCGENNDKSKFFIDVSKELETRDLIAKLLKDANNKSYGREIILKDLVIASMPKLTQKDIERIQENALTDMEKIERLLASHNERNKTALTLGEFLVMKLNV